MTPRLVVSSDGAGELDEDAAPNMDTVPALVRQLSVVVAPPRRLEGAEAPMLLESVSSFGSPGTQLEGSPGGRSRK